MHCSLSCIISYIEDGDWWRAYMIVMWCTISQRMVTCIVNVHPWLWCCPARHVCLSYGESANDSLSLVTNRITPRTENPLQTHTHTHTQTHHTHTLWHFHIYIEDSSNREDIIAIAICSECYVANAIAISSTTPSDSCMICEAGRLRSSWQVHTNVGHYTCTCNQGDLDL